MLGKHEGLHTWLYYVLPCIRCPGFVIIYAIFLAFSVVFSNQMCSNCSSSMDVGSIMFCYHLCCSSSMIFRQNSLQSLPLNFGFRPLFLSDAGVFPWFAYFFITLETTALGASSFFFFFFVLLLKRYNLYKFLACSTTFFQISLFYATFFQLSMFMLFISSKTSSCQRVLGLQMDLLDVGFHLLTFCTILSSAMRSIWPNKFNLCFLINTIIFCPFNI